MKAVRSACYLFAILVPMTLGCNKNDGSKNDAAKPDPASGAQPASADAAGSTKPAAAETGPAMKKAVLGAEAPDFELTSLDGEKVKLSDYRGKTVVLEWFNPQCPFVKQSHTEGTLKGMAKRYRDDGVVWLAINSNKAGSQGASVEAMKEGRESFGIDYPILLDPDGTVGKAYGAKHTPHMYVIHPDGRLVYRGALDSSKGGDLEDVPDLVDYVGEALKAVKENRPVEISETEAWGCTVKYAN